MSPGPSLNHSEDRLIDPKGWIKARLPKPVFDKWQSALNANNGKDADPPFLFIHADSIKPRHSLNSDFAPINFMAEEDRKKLQPNPRSFDFFAERRQQMERSRAIFNEEFAAAEKRIEAGRKRMNAKHTNFAKEFRETNQRIDAAHKEMKKRHADFFGQRETMSNDFPAEPARGFFSSIKQAFRLRR